jgi:hypothetical protein
MKHHTVRARVNRKTTDVARPVSSAGKDGVSIDPPNYGIDFLDSELSTTAAVSGLAAAIQLKQATGPGRRILTANAAQAESTGYLPSNLKAGIEHLSGVALDGVKVHYNSTKPARLQAVAFAQGTNIYLAPGQEKCLPHEAWHVVQQKQGRVKPTNQISGVAINANSGLENEANIMGVKAYRMNRSHPRPISQAFPGAAPSGQDGSTQESESAGMKATDTRRMTPKAESTEGAVAQRLIGLELEFPIPVDRLGELTPKQEELLKGPLTKEREELQNGANLVKDETIFEDKGQGFAAVVDHGQRLDALRQETPARAIWYNVLEYKFKPPVETLEKVKSVLDNIYAGVKEVGVRTKGLTERVKAKNGYYVGPINTNGKKPEELGTRAYSLQVNVGVVKESIADFIGGFAKAPELGGTKEVQIRFRRCLTEARQIAQDMVQQVRERDLEEGTQPPLSGLEGLFAIIALYLLAGKEEGAVQGGTVKNFTPLLLKTPISTLVARTLDEKEKNLWNSKRESYLKDLLTNVRGEKAKLEGFLVLSKRGVSAGDRVKDLITDKWTAPFVRGKSMIPATISHRMAVFETRYGGGNFGLDEAYQRAKEVFEIVQAALWDEMI